MNGRPEARGELPVVELAHEITTPGAGQVRAVITVAGNPVRSTPDTERLDAALASLEFMVSVDPYLNETTRHADVILPPPSPLEKAHFSVAFQGLSVRNVANWSEPIFEHDGWTEHQILAALALIGSGFDPLSTPTSVVTDLILGEIAGAATRLANGPLDGRDPAELVILADGDDDIERIVDMLVRTGAYGDAFGARPGGLTLAALKAAPHGIDFGPLQPRVTHVVSTASGMVELAPEPLLNDLDRLRDELATHSPTDGSLVLIGRRHLRSNNSWMHNIPRLVTGRDRCTVLMNGADATSRNLVDGQLVSVATDAGSIDVPLEVSDEMAVGVVSVPHGWGHDAPGTQMRVANAHAGANVNSIIPASIIDPVSGNGQLNGVPVTVAAAASPSA